MLNLPGVKNIFLELHEIVTDSYLEDNYFSIISNDTSITVSEITTVSINVKDNYEKTNDLK